MAKILGLDLGTNSIGFCLRDTDDGVNIIEQMNDFGSIVFQSGVGNSKTGEYSYAAETHPYSEDDMIEFAEWNELSGWHFNGTTKNWWSDIYPALFPTTKELLQLWKSKQPKVIYFI